MLNKLPAFLFYPLALCWSLLYGTLGGVFFRLLSVYEHWVELNRLQLLLWKKFPRRSYRNYINSLWLQQVRGKPLELAEYTRSRIEQRHPAEPFPILRLFANTLFMLLIAPWMALRGLFEGPIYVFRRSLALRQNDRQLISR